MLAPKKGKLIPVKPRPKEVYKGPGSMYEREQERLKGRGQYDINRSTLDPTRDIKRRPITPAKNGLSVSDFAEAKASNMKRRTLPRGY
jgi:hypothetical protein